MAGSYHRQADRLRWAHARKYTATSSGEGKLLDSEDGRGWQVFGTSSLLSKMTDYAWFYRNGEFRFSKVSDV